MYATLYLGGDLAIDRLSPTWSLGVVVGWLAALDGCRCRCRSADSGIVVHAELQAHRYLFVRTPPSDSLLSEAHSLYNLPAGRSRLND